jgi:hypothetical protein
LELGIPEARQLMVKKTDLAKNISLNPLEMKIYNKENLIVTTTSVDFMMCDPLYTYILIPTL